MTKSATKMVLEHPECDHIIAKLLIGVSPKDIYDTLKIQYSNIGEKQFIISEKTLLKFKKEGLDLYKYIKEDLEKIKNSPSIDQELQLAIKGNSAYKETLTKLAGEELDLKTSIVNMITALDTRIEQIFNEIQADPTTINTRTERLLTEFISQWKGVIELYNKVVLQAPDQIIQHNVTVQHIDQHIGAILDAIRKTLSQFDVEASLRFMEIFSEEMEKLKPPIEQQITPVEERFAEVRVINEQIDKQLNGPE